MNILAALIVCVNKHAYRATPTDLNGPTTVLANVAINYDIYKRVIKYRHILYDDNDYNDNYTIINTNLATSIWGQ